MSDILADRELRDLINQLYDAYDVLEGPLTDPLVDAVHPDESQAKALQRVARVLAALSAAQDYLTELREARHG